MSTKTKIKWKACGFDLADRKGSSDGIKDEVQITFSRGKFDVAFHHAKKASVDSMEEAKQYAEDNIQAWQQARKAEREAYESKRLEDSRKAAESQQRQTDLVNQLKALGIDARDGIGIQISHEAAQELVLRLQGVGKVPQPATAPINPEPALGLEMATLVAS